MLNYQHCSSNAYLPIVLSFGGVARVAFKAPPKTMAKSFTSILSNGLPPNLLLKKSSVHFSSAWDVVACHCRIEGQETMFRPGRMIRTRYRTLNSTLTWFPWPLVTSIPFLSLIGYITRLAMVEQ